MKQAMRRRELTSGFARAQPVSSCRTWSMSRAMAAPNLGKYSAYQLRSNIRRRTGALYPTIILLIVDVRETTSEFIRSSK
jgi:hypothetical protein